MFIPHDTTGDSAFRFPEQYTYLKRTITINEVY